jgi:hypothetical protein
VIIQDRIKSKSVLTPKEWDEATQSLLKTLTPEEWEVFQEYINGDLSIPEILAAHEYSEPPVPIEEFLDDPYYLGESTKGLFKPLREDIELIFSSGHYEIALLTGALGIGKSEFASICILRMLYEASCLKDPAVSYGLTSGSKIGFCMLAPSEQVARAATFDKITGKILKSEYFMNVFAPKNRFQDGKAFKGNELNFPKGLSILCGSSSDNAVLGANIMGGFVDELNFFRKDAKSAPVQSPRYGGYSRAGRIFDGLRRRIKSRFASRGKLPGILIGASSKTTKDSLTEQFIRESAANGEAAVFVRDYSIVDVKPQAFSGHKFKVLVGNEYYSSKILEGGDDKDYGEDAIIIDAPEELRPDFMRDLDMCLTGETKIPLLDGTEVEIKELINKKEFGVYSCTLNGGVVPGRGHSARITRHTDEIYTIHLENGKCIKCTGNHPFMLKDGTYKNAEDLSEEDDLMSFVDPYILTAALMEYANRKSEGQGGWFSFDGGKYFGENK